MDSVQVEERKVSEAEDPVEGGPTDLHIGERLEAGVGRGRVASAVPTEHLQHGREALYRGVV